MTRNAPPETCQHPSCAGMPPMPDPTSHKIVRGHPIMKGVVKVETVRDQWWRGLLGADE